MVLCATGAGADTAIGPEVLSIAILGALFVAGLLIRMVQYWRGSHESGKALPLAPPFMTRRSILNCILALMPFVIGFLIFKIQERSAEQQERLERRETEAVLDRLERRLERIESCTDIDGLVAVLRSPENLERSCAATRLFDLLREVAVSRLADADLGYERHRSKLVLIPPRWCREASESLERWYSANRDMLEFDDMTSRLRWKPAVPNAVRRERAYIFQPLP